VQLMRGRRLTLDASVSRPTATGRTSQVQPSAMGRTPPVGVDNGSTYVLGAGRARMPKYSGLRGGTQLVWVGNDTWLGVAHDMQFVGGKKRYWHIWYSVTSRGKMKAMSEPMKLAPNGIEFAAGMGIDGDRVVVSFGVDDMESKLGVTSLSAILELLKPCKHA
jgi:hypothetical protein